MKMERDYLNDWIKNGHIRKNHTYKGEPQRSSWRTQKKKTKEQDSKGNFPGGRVQVPEVSSLSDTVKVTPVPFLAERA